MNKLTILAVDDVLANRISLQYLIEEYCDDIDVVLAESGEDALRITYTLDIHLIILDIEKPGAQECPKHRDIAELGKSMDTLTVQEVAKILNYWELGPAAVAAGHDAELDGGRLMAFNARDFKEMGIGDMALCKKLAALRKEMDRKGGAPYHVIG